MSQLQTPSKPDSGTQLMRDVGEAVRGFENRDLLIYIHVPFCSSKCVFCDWVADIAVKDLIAGSSLGGKYVEALCRQIRCYAPQLKRIGYVPKYVYWGGGTPSRLSTEQILEIVSTLKECFDLSTVEQHTLEASAETLTAEKLEAMRSVGIDRISMGVQSFDDAELRRSARSHSAEQAKTAAREIRRAGFEDFNLDLITALPGQEIETLEHSVSTAIELDPPHVSIYSYRPDPRTTLAKQSAAGHRERVDRNKMLGFYGRAKELLEAAGYAEYMTSYFAKEPEHRFKGETYYFELQGDYIGFGSGAYSLLGHRYFRNSSDLHSFIDNPFEIESCELFNTGGPYDTLAILIGSALLTSAGLNFARFERIAGFGFSEICDQPAIKRLIEYYADCGAVFEETNDALLVVPETRTQAYITHMSGMYEVSWLRRGL